jgi:hypothetical protein
MAYFLASAAIDDSFKTVPTDMSRPLFSDSLGFYSCEDDGIDPLNVAQLQEIHSNRSTLPANVFVIQTELGNGKDSNGRVRSLPIIAIEAKTVTKQWTRHICWYCFEAVVNGSRRHITFTLDLGTSRRISSRKWFNCKNKRSIQVK